MKFIGREEQLSKIEKEIQSDDMRTVLVYGRRRVGKSELIKQALQRTRARSIYYECKQVAEASNVQNPVYEGEHRRRSGRTDDGGGWKTGNRGKRRAGKREKDCLRGRSFLLF